MKEENLSQSDIILKVAYRCISEKGYANVSLRDIASEAKVALSQLNYYYKNKEGLFLEVTKVLTAKFLKEIEDTLKKGSTEEEKLADLVSYFRHLNNHSTDSLRLLYDLTGMALWSDSFKSVLEDLFKSSADIIEQYIITPKAEQSLLKKVSKETLARTILGTLYGISLLAILAPEEKNIYDPLSNLALMMGYEI
ncbi:MAG: TetR/AcrR family transcriptional regulator [Bacillota bacterium]|nr:TetR/AcrR family transcriptional regulator [Bacillota bacterium]